MSLGDGALWKLVFRLCARLADGPWWRSAEERQRLAEAVKHHQINHTAVRDQPEGALPSSSSAAFLDVWQLWLRLPCRTSGGCSSKLTSKSGGAGRGQLDVRA